MRHDVEQTLTPEVMKIRVLIPIYRALDTDEERALKNNCRMLAAHDIALLVPEGLDVEAAAALAPQAEVVRVTDEWLGRHLGQENPKSMAALTALMTRFCAGEDS